MLTDRGSPILTTDNIASPSPIGVPAGGLWLTTVQFLSRTCIRPAPDASWLREKNTPAVCIRSWAACRFIQVTSGIRTNAAWLGWAAGAAGTLLVGAFVVATTGGATLVCPGAAADVIEATVGVTLTVTVCGVGELHPTIKIPEKHKPVRIANLVIREWLYRSGDW